MTAAQMDFSISANTAVQVFIYTFPIFVQGCDAYVYPFFFSSDVWRPVSSWRSTQSGVQAPLSTSIMVSWIKDKRGLAVLINNSNQAIPEEIITRELRNANYDVETFQNIKTYSRLQQLVVDLTFPYATQDRFKSLQKLKEKHRDSTLNTSVRPEIYSRIADSLNFSELVADMRMYQADSSTAALERDYEFEPSLFVIYLGESVTSNHELLIRNEERQSCDILAKEDFIHLFDSADYTHFPSNVCKIFTFATTKLEHWNDDYKYTRYFLEKVNKGKKNNVIDIQLRKSEIGFSRFIYFFTNFLVTQDRRLRGISKFLETQTDMIESFNVKVFTNFKFQIQKKKPAQEEKKKPQPPPQEKKLQQQQRDYYLRSRRRRASTILPLAVA